MPLEVTPVPFSNQQLPYTPKFIPPEIEDMPPGMGSNLGQPMAPGLLGPGSLARGPASAAASAIIPPTPGGIAGPHHAIPALPDAGYTAPVRPASLALDRAPPYVGMSGKFSPNVGGYGDARSAYGGASVYGGFAPTSYDMPAPLGSAGMLAPPSALGGGVGGWGASSLPSPRRPSVAPSNLITAETNVISPRHLHEHRHHHEQNQQEQRGRVHYSPAEHQHHHHHNSPVRVKTTIDDDGMSDASYYAMPRNKHRSDSMSSASASESGSPGRRRSASLNYRNRQNHPFPSTDAVRPGHHRTPSFQGQAHEHSPISPSPLARAPFVKDKDKETRSPLAPTRDRETNDNVDDQLAPERGRGRKHSQLRHAPGSLSDSESIPPRRRHHSRALERENENHDHSQRHGQEHEHRHHRHRSTSQVPPLNRVPSPLPSIQGRHDGPAPPSLAAASYIPPIDLQDAYEGRAHESRRRRALSFQGFEAPPMVPYQTPSIAGMGPVMAYDDGVSIAGSQMTFMDGSVGGRVSQYGLPKYAHQPKVDWRRFCVQRGNADVFLD